MCETDESDKNVANKGANPSVCVCVYIYIYIYLYIKLKKLSKKVIV